MSGPQSDAPASRTSGGFQISSWSIKNPIPTIVFFLLMTLLGIMGFNNMRVNNFPDIDLPYVIVTVMRSGAAPTELENQVTRIVEDSVSSLENIRNTQSFVNEGASTTMVQFQLGTDLEKATNDVRNAVAGVRGNLPSDVIDPVISRVDNVSGQPLLIYTIRAANMTPEELSWYVDNDIAKRVLGVKGVSKVNRNGGVNREIRVELDAEKLAARGVTAGEISQALSSYNVNMPGGRFNAGGTEQTIRTLGNATTVEQLSETRISTQSGGSVKLSELATITDTWSEPRTRARFNGNEVVAFDIQRSRGSSEVHVAKQVEEVLANLQAENPNIKLELVATSVEEVNLSYEESFKALIEGALLAVVVVFLFLRDWRATLVAATAIPMSLLPTFYVMYAINESFNIVSLLALALTIGILVDDAIVEIENIVRHMRAGKKPYQAAIEAADEIGLAVVATTATLIAVFAPTGFMPGIVGQFFKTFAIASCLSVFFSLVVARTLTPLMGAYLLRVKPGQEKMHDEPFWMPTYLRMLDWALSDHIKWRWALVFLAVVVGLPLLIVGLMSSQLAVSAMGAVLLAIFSVLAVLAGQKYMKARWALLMVGVVTFLGFVFMAASPYLMAMAPGGTAAADNAWIGSVITLLIGLGVLALVIYGIMRMKHQFLTAGWGVFVMGTFFFIGSIALVSTIPSDNIPADDMSMSVMSITLPPGTTLEQTEAVVSSLTEKLQTRPEVKSVYSVSNMNTATITANLVARKKREITQTEFESEFSEYLHDYPGVHASFGQEGGGGTGVSYMFVSDNYEQLNRAGIDLMRDLSSLPELANVHSDDLLVRPELIITPKPEQAALMGVSTMAISQAARIATMGDIDQVLAKFNDGDRQVPIRVLFKEDTRTDMMTLQTLQVPTRFGTSVPLTAVADITFGAGPIQLNRIDRTRSFSVKGDLNGPQGLADTAVANTPTMKAIAEGKYPGVRPRVSPQTEDFAEMIPNFIIAILTGIALMYVVLVLLFGKFSHPFTILMALPVSFGGAFIALIMFGMTLSMPALIGLIMLTGIAAKNSILLVEYAMVSMQHGMSRHDALMDAAHKRARPIIMTTIAMGAGMVPVAIGEDAFRQPMAIAVIGGLITSTLLSLLFIPVMYVLIDRVANFIGKFFKPFLHAQGKEDEEPTPPPPLH